VQILNPKHEILNLGLSSGWKQIQITKCGGEVPSPRAQS